jgi:hypothetical protein
MLTANTITEPNYTTAVNMNAIDKLLENEKQKNKCDTWNKLDKTVKTQKLHAFAEKYGKDHNYSAKDVKMLKTFFTSCLEQSKLQKTKDVVYDKDSGEIISIPALFFNSVSHSFTLKIIDTKRVSTLKSLTPKRVSEKNQTTANKTAPERGTSVGNDEPVSPK